jgi:hypothetical protein
MGRQKQLLKVLYSTVLTILFWSFGMQQVKATHAMGADLSWECIGPNQYRITLKLYRDCNGVNMSNTVWCSA